MKRIILIFLIFIMGSGGVYLAILKFQELSKENISESLTKNQFFEEIKVPETPPPAPPPPEVVQKIVQPTPKPIELPIKNLEPKEFVIYIRSFTDVEPANLVVSVGDTVTFINEDNDLHWPGSDPHPTHSSLTTFDALGGISQNQSYSHTFRKSGTFGYHEHLLDNPPTLGVITVLP